VVLRVTVSFGLTRYRWISLVVGNTPGSFASDQAASMRIKAAFSSPSMHAA
jgi:hypothetical protein